MLGLGAWTSVLLFFGSVGAAARVPVGPIPKYGNKVLEYLAIILFVVHKRKRLVDVN